MNAEAPIRVAVVGASGYVGGELLRLLSQHPRVLLTAVTSEQSAGKPVHETFPYLQSVVPLIFESLELDSLAERVDTVFLALPPTHSFEPVSRLMKAGKRVIDLSADFRLQDASQYHAWYHTDHPFPDLLRESVYGIPELHRADIASSRLVGSPGCYPTAAILQLAPLAATGLIQQHSIVIDAKSGISGAGRSPALPYHFPEAHESLEAYNIGRHRHIPEIEQELNRLAHPSTGQESTSQAEGRYQEAIRVMFTPHLVPMNRGIQSTAYCRLIQPCSLHDLQSLYQDFYNGEPFIRLLEDNRSANPRHVRGSNFCDIGLHYDARTDTVVTTAALDNLVKGASGQAIQAFNLMLGLPESLGLPSSGIFP